MATRQEAEATSRVFVAAVAILGRSFKRVPPACGQKSSVSHPDSPEMSSARHLLEATTAWRIGEGPGRFLRRCSTGHLHLPGSLCPSPAIPADGSVAALGYPAQDEYPSMLAGVFARPLAPTRLACWNEALPLVQGNGSSVVVANVQRELPHTT